MREVTREWISKAEAEQVNKALRALISAIPEKK